jgi:hypothetical protein
MEINKLRRLVDKYQLSNILKVLILLLILYILARIFIPYISSNVNVNIINLASNIKKDVLEGFSTCASMGYPCYGNELILQDPKNMPVYQGNTVTFRFNDINRIEGFQIVFNPNSNANSQPDKFIALASTSSPTITVEYEDANGNLQHISTGSNSGTVPNHISKVTGVGNNTKPFILSEVDKDLIDEYGLAVYTSKIVITIGDTSNIIDSYIDSCGIGYISKFAFWGSTRDMLSRSSFGNQTCNSQAFIKQNPQTSTGDVTNIDSYDFKNTADYLIYGLKVSYKFDTITSINASPITTNPACSSNSIMTNTPFNLTITYSNGLYPGNNFKINQLYYIRNDPLKMNNGNVGDAFIIFSMPIIAQHINIAAHRAVILDGSDSSYKLNLAPSSNNPLMVYGNTPTNMDITNYQKTVNLLLNASKTNASLDVCPSMDDLVSKQNQAQAICDNLDYQDRIKSEKIRLEKNKQYLLKLQEQQKQIDQLNTVIQTLDTKRQIRDKNVDTARLLQYQQQKETASTIRDLALQRQQSQANNQLYMDVNINTI